MNRSDTKRASGGANTGLFISIEGIEGTGKSTHAAFVAEWFRCRGQQVVMTREPGGTPLAEDLRALLLTPRVEIVDPTAELLLMFAARAQHLSEVILPALDGGAVVVCDRFTDATFAYQGAGRGQDTQFIQRLADFVHGTRWPDLTLLLTVPPVVGLMRARKRAALDRFEQEETDFYERVQRAYIERAVEDPARIQRFDAEASLDVIQQSLAASLETWWMARRRD